MNFRSKPWSLVAVTAAVLLALTGLTSSATAATARTLTVKSSPVYLYAGAPITFSGAVSKSPRGTVVKIQRKAGAKWVAAGQTRTTTAAGAYALKLNAPSTPAAYTYRAFAPRTAKLAGAYSRTTTKVTVLRRTSVALTIAPTSITTGGSATFSGRVNPYTPGRTVTVQRYSGTSWVNVATATLSGTGTYSTTVTPAGTGTFYYRTTSGLNGLNAGGASGTRPLTVSDPAAPVITTTSLPDATQGVGYSAPLAKTGGAGTWSAPNLPAGLTIDAQTGVISGTTNVAAATYQVNVTFTETTGGQTATRQLALKVLPGQVNPPTGPTITTTTLPDGDQGLPYSATLTKTGGAGTWAIAPGPQLKPGLSLDPATGVISGTPTGNSQSNFTVTFTETSTGLVASKTLSMYINPLPTITTATLPDATQGVAYSAPLAKTGKAGTWSALGLPAGLSINAETGVISGTTNVAAATYGVYPTFTETAGGRTTTRALALKVLPGQVNPPTGPTITTTTLPDGDQGRPYSATLTKTGGAGTWAIAPGPGLKPGLSLDPATGVISGTPTGNSQSNFTVTFTETGTGLVASKNLSMYISPLPTITTTTLPDATRNAPYSATLTKNGKPGTWSIQGLPSGLSINAETGEISGTTAVAVGDYGVYPTFTETSTGRSTLKALALHVGGTTLAITTGTNLPDAHKSAPYSVTFAKTGGDGTWSGAQLPAGLTLDPATGTLSGTPTVAALNAVYITFTETTGGSVTKIFALRVVQPKITTTSIPGAVTGTPYSAQLAKTGLDGTWTVAGFLPAGLTFSPAGLLSGTPTETGEFQLLVTFTETSTGESSKMLYNLHVEAPGSPAITTASLPNGTIGTPYSATLVADPTGGTWAVTDGSLPVGLSLNPTTGAITGTPVVAENAAFVVTYTKGATKNTKFLRLVVPAAP